MEKYIENIWNSEFSLATKQDIVKEYVMHYLIGYENAFVEMRERAKNTDLESIFEDVRADTQKKICEKLEEMNIPLDFVMEVFDEIEVVRVELQKK